VTRKTWLIGSGSLTPDQTRVAHASPEEHQLVTGPAGSGKTLLLLHRANHLMREYNVDSSRLGVLVYTNVLKRYIRSGVQELGLEEGMVQLFYDWVTDYYQENIRSRLPWNRERKGTDYVRVVREVLEDVRRRPSSPVFDVLLVDEGQDLPPEAFHLLPLLAQHVTVFSDPTQRLYSDGATMGDAVKGLGLRRESQVLLQNLRNAPAVARAAACFLPPNEAEVYLRTRAVPDSSAFRVPLLYEAKNGTDEINRLIEITKGEINQGKRVGILLPTNDMVKGIAKAYEEKGVEVETVLARGDIKEDFNVLTPKVLTVHSAKGLTFDTVLIPRIVESKYGWARNVDKMLFVAATRALEWVYFGTVARDMCDELKRLLPLEDEGQLEIHTPETVIKPDPTQNDGDDMDIPI